MRESVPQPPHRADAYVRPRIELNEQLPPPNWSPTGNSGYWKWRENEKGDMSWQWFDDNDTLTTPPPTRTTTPAPWSDRIWKYLSTWRQS